MERAADGWYYSPRIDSVSVVYSNEAAARAHENDQWEVQRWSSAGRGWASITITRFGADQRYRFRPIGAVSATEAARVLHGPKSKPKADSNAILDGFNEAVTYGLTASEVIANTRSFADARKTRITAQAKANANEPMSIAEWAALDQTLDTSFITNTTRCWIDEANSINKAYLGNPIQPKETTMSYTTNITIEHRTLVNGRNIKDYKDAEVYDLIGQQEAEVERLEKIKNKPKMLVKEIADRKAGIQALVDYLDAKAE